MTDQTDIPAREDDRPLRHQSHKIFQIALKEVGALIAVAALCLGFVAFFGIAEEVAEGEFVQLDETIVTALRTSGSLERPIGPDWLMTSMADITALGGYSVLTLMITMTFLYLLVAKRLSDGALVVLAVATGTLVSTGLKVLFDRARPDLVPHLVEATSASFPSGHAMLSAVSYLTLGAILAQSHSQKRIRILVMTFAVIITLLVGISRVYLGVHWPTDVLAGWSFGAAWASLWWIIGWLLRRWNNSRASTEPTA